MRLVPTEFQQAIEKARAEGARTLSLRGYKGDQWGSPARVLFELPQAVFELDRLEELDLSNNLLRLLPTIPSGIRHLNLAENPLEVVPQQSGLILDSRQYQQFQGSIDPRQVIGLKFRRGELPMLAEWLGKNGPLAHLEYLDLSNTLLRELPDTINNLSNLTTLNLSNNHLSTLPYSISSLSNLTTLDLSSNQLSTLPSSIAFLSGLISLNLGTNKLTSTTPRKFVKNIHTVIALP